MADKIKHLQTHFWRDKDGKVVLWQSPNSLLITWAFLAVFRHFLRTGNFRTFVGYGATAAIFLWAVWEITQGVNYFRRLVGLIVLLMIIVSWVR